MIGTRFLRCVGTPEFTLDYSLLTRYNAASFLKDNAVVCVQGDLAYSLIGVN